MWIQKGNSQRWSIYKDDDLYYSFSWSLVSSGGKFYKAKYIIEYYVTTGIYRGLMDKLSPTWSKRINFGSYPEAPKSMSKAAKDELWERIHRDPIGFIVKMSL